jgi:hypothetical protein
MIMKQTDIDNIVENIQNASKLFNSILEDNKTSSEHHSLIETALILCEEILRYLQESNLQEAKKTWSNLVRFISDSFPWWLDNFSEQWTVIEKKLSKLGFKS